MVTAALRIAGGAGDPGARTRPGLTRARAWPELPIRLENIRNRAIVLANYPAE